MVLTKIKPEEFRPPLIQCFVRFSHLFEICGQRLRHIWSKGGREQKSVHAK
jgi:hypothetical protein